MAQQAAAAAQAAAAKAQAAAMAEQQAVERNAAAVTTLQATVTDLKGNQASLATTVSDETAKIKKQIDSPSVLHYKGISLTPGGFVAAETVYRTKATGGDIPTAFSSIPYEGADAYSLSEFYGSARQSRITLLAEGKTNWGTLRGYYEADWLGTGITSNNNQSNSYVLRQRVLYAQAETNTGWTFAGGQMWSLATEGKKGISSAPQRHPDSADHRPELRSGLRVDPPVRLPRGQELRAKRPSASRLKIRNCSTPPRWPATHLTRCWAAAATTAATTTPPSAPARLDLDRRTTPTRQRPTRPATPIDVAVPVYKTVNSCANVANISFNQAPDMIVKVAFDPGWGHYEIFGIAGFAHETVYPGETTNSNLYGGLTDIEGYNGGTPAAPSGSSVHHRRLLRQQHHARRRRRQLRVFR